MIQELKTRRFKTFVELKAFVQQAAKLLMQARPTEPMLFNGMKCALATLKANDIKKVQAKVINALKIYLLDIQ